MRTIKLVLAHLVLISILYFEFSGYAQPKIPKDQIPSDVPADVRVAIEGLYSTDAKDRTAAILQLEGVGDRAEPAIPFLIEMLNDVNNVSFRVVKVLAGMSEPGVEALIGAIQRQWWTVRAHLIDALDEMNDYRAIVPLLALVKDPEVEVRGKADRALIRIKDHRAVKPLITTGLKDKDPDVRYYTIQALEGLRYRRAIEPLIEVLKKDPDYFVRAEAIEALRSLSDSPTFDLEAEIDKMKAKDGRRRYDTADLLGERKDFRAIQSLIDLVGDKNREIRQTANYALWKLTGENFRQNPEKWQNWWEQNKENFPIDEEMRDDRSKNQTDSLIVEALLDVVKEKKSDIFRQQIISRKQIISLEKEAVKTLGEIKHSRAVEAIIEIMTLSPEDFYELYYVSARIEAKKTLREIKGFYAVRPLVRVLVEGPWIEWIQVVVAETLKRLISENLEKWNKWWKQNKDRIPKELIIEKLSPESANKTLKDSKSDVVLDVETPSQGKDKPLYHLYHLNDYIGLQYPPLPKGVKELHGVILEPELEDYWLSEMSHGNVRMLWFSKLIGRDTQGKAYFEVKDAISLPEVQKGESFLMGGCEINKQADPEIVAIAELDTLDVIWTKVKKIKWAWRANRASEKIESLPTNGIVCILDSIMD